MNNFSTRFTTVNQNPLSNEQLMVNAPSLFADHAHERTSTKYSYLPTIQVIEGMRGSGWMPVWAAEQRVRLEDRRGFQKHMIRFRHSDNFGAALAVNDFFPEVVLVNSHDGSSSYQIHAGIFRLVCGNGMIVADSTFQTVRVKHVGFDPAEVIAASYRVVDEVPKVNDQIQEWKHKQLTDGQQKAFAEAALVMRYDSIDEAPIRPEMALRRRRTADAAPDVWSTLNVVQENIINGGLKDYGKRKPTGDRFRRMTAVKGIDENVRLNKALWHLADALAKAV